MLYKDIIFGLFGKEDKLIDVNIDGAGKGTLERYNEIIGDDIDTEIVTLLNIVDKVYPDTVMTKFLGYKEIEAGNTLYLDGSSAMRNKILKLLRRLNAIKGTKKCYEVLFNLLGYQLITLTEDTAIYGFDSPLTFDDLERVFDLKCFGCGKYSLDVDSALGMPTPDIFRAMLSIIKYNEPINAKLNHFTMLGGPLVTYSLVAVLNLDGSVTAVNPYDVSFKIVYDGVNYNLTSDFGAVVYTGTFPNYTFDYK